MIKLNTQIRTTLDILLRCDINLKTVQIYLQLTPGVFIDLAFRESIRRSCE